MNLLKGSVVIYYLTSSTLLMARLIDASFVSLLFILFKFNIIRQLCGFGVRFPFKWIQPLNFSLLVSFQNLLLPLCPLSQSYFRMLILSPLHWKTCALVHSSFFPSSIKKSFNSYETDSPCWRRKLTKLWALLQVIPRKNRIKYRHTDTDTHTHTHTEYATWLNRKADFPCSGPLPTSHGATCFA